MVNKKTDTLLQFIRLVLLVGILFICILPARRPTTESLLPAQEFIAPNPLPPFPSVELEELTWMDVRDRIRGGLTRVLVPTGGIEQNGPFVSLSKHNYIARAVSLRAAELLGSTLVAPVVPFVPQGNIRPPTGHMLFSGTISLKEKTFEALLEDIGTSLAVHGFTEVVFLGDSADNQRGMQKAAAQINKRFHQSPSRAFYIPEFYNYPELRKFLAQRGIEEHPEDFHEELAFSLQLLAISPPTLRYEQRIAAGHTTLGGLSLLDRDKLVALGKEIIEMRAQSTVKAIKERELMPERK